MNAVEKGISQQQLTAEPRVSVRGSGERFAQEIVAGIHALRADEPINAGGTDTGPTPYDFLLAALGACTSMTPGMYARAQKWPLQRIVVRLRHSKIHAEDCVECEAKRGILDQIEREVELIGPLTPEQRSRLLEVANKRPVHRTLKSEVHIQTRPA
jgi:uncharacterized OsmC-like protein